MIRFRAAANLAGLSTHRILVRICTVSMRALSTPWRVLRFYPNVSAADASRLAACDRHDDRGLLVEHRVRRFAPRFPIAFQ
jgi:hypothetical protein